MSKQSKIREGIEKFIFDDREDMRHNKGYSVPNRARQLINYLHSERCRIEVDRELPITWMDKGVDGYREERYLPKGLHESFEQAGYVATIPIIEE